jgi:hypothetical protein
VPRYYFNIRDGKTSLDSEGTELSDLMAARKMAVTVSGEVLREGADQSLWSGSPWELWVTDRPDGQGKTYFTLRFSAVENTE